MASISDILDDIDGGGVSVGTCVGILHASEGVGASSAWTGAGHSLQHSAQPPGSPGFRRIDDAYHFRGPLPIEKEVKGGPQVGKFKGAFRVEDDGSIKTFGTPFHSQFLDDDQAGTCLKLLLESGGGLWALRLLRNHVRLSVAVRYGMPGGTKYLHRASQLVGVGTPSTPDDRYIERSKMESSYNFVLIDRRDMGSVVGILRVKDSPAGHLHVQTLYPDPDPLQPGTSVVSVDASKATGYGGPSSMTFLL